MDARCLELFLEDLEKSNEAAVNLIRCNAEAISLLKSAFLKSNFFVLVVKKQSWNISAFLSCWVLHKSSDALI